MRLSILLLIIISIAVPAAAEDGGGPHRLDSLKGRISYEPRAFEKIKRHQAASAKG